MITQYEVSSILTQEIPQLSRREYSPQPDLNVYLFMNYFLGYTRQTVGRHQYFAAKKCFSLAERFYRQGDPVVRSLIENIFVFGLTSVLALAGTEKTLVRSLIPDTLYRLYLKQIYQSGC